MQSELSKIMFCNRCGEKELELSIDCRDDIEILEGRLSCNSCDNFYAIREGIVDTIAGKTITELLTAKENDEPETSKMNEWLFSLPTPKYHVRDTTYEHKGGDKALNFFDVLSRMKLKGNETILEFGCGNCWATNIFAKKGCKCVAVDVRMRRYYGLRSGKIMINHFDRYFERVLSDLQNPAFVAGSFDIIFAQSSLQYADNLNYCLGNIHTLLRPGGKLVLAYNGVYGLLKRKGKGSPGYYVTTLLRAMKRAGFEYELIFPAYVKKYLEDRIPNGKKFATVGNIVSFIWNTWPHAVNRIEKHGQVPMHLVFGVPLNLIAEKQKQ